MRTFFGSDRGWGIGMCYLTLLCDDIVVEIHGVKA